jgi:hypothetical protein
MNASRWAADFGVVPAGEPPLEVRDDDAAPPPEPPPARPVKDAKPRVQRGGVPGLTAAGVAVIVLAASTLGAVIDSIVGDDLGPFFAVLFVASSVYAATQVRRRDLLAAVIVPPLVFLTILGAHEILSPTGKSQAAIDLMGDLVSSLALNAPTLWVGTGAAAVVVFVRHRRR